MAGRGRAAPIPGWLPSASPASAGASPAMAFPPPPPAAGPGTQPNPIVPASATDPAFSVWTEHTAPDGRRKYWHNASVGRSTYEKPVCLMTATERADSTTRWKEAVAPDGRVYFHNVDTKQTKWQMPEEVRVAREAALRVEGAAAAKAAVAAAEALSKGGPHLSSEKAGGTTSFSTKTSYASPAEALDAFLQSLADANVTSAHRWDEASRLAVGDPKFLALKSAGERKKAFHEYQTKRVKKEREERRALDKKKRDAFTAMLNEAETVCGCGAPREAFRQVAEDLIKHPLYAQRFKDVVEDKAKEDLYRAHCESARARARSGRRRRREEEKDKFTELLREKNIQTWRDVGGLRDEPRYEQCDRYDRLCAFELFSDAVDKAERDMRDSETFTRRIDERRRRDGFVAFLTEKRKLGELSLRLPWRDFFENEGLRTNDVYTELQKNQGGSRPKELYEDEQEVLEIEAAACRGAIVAALVSTETLSNADGSFFGAEVSPTCASVRRALAGTDATGLLTKATRSNTTGSVMEQTLSAIPRDGPSATNSSPADNRLRLAIRDAVAVATRETKSHHRQSRRALENFTKMLERVRRRHVLRAGSSWDVGEQVLGREPEWKEVCDFPFDKKHEPDFEFETDNVDRASVLESAKQRFRDLFSAEDGELEEGEAPVAKRPKVDG
jgi:pre-mRNA-processing factor 40